MLIGVGDKTLSDAAGVPGARRLLIIAFIPADFVMLAETGSLLLTSETNASIPSDIAIGLVFDVTKESILERLRTLGVRLTFVPDEPSGLPS